MTEKGMVRTPKLLALAKGQPCQAQIPGICTNNQETTVAAHSNHQRHGKGMGIKASDCFIAFTCSACHQAIDGQTHACMLSREDRDYYWESAHIRTMVYLWRNGMIRVA